MECKVCPKCEAKFMEGQLYWHTGAIGDPHDLAGLVCNDYGDDRCINPCKGSDSGDTWEKRREMMEGMQNEINRMIDKMGSD
jgi:hypothetical protein